MSESTMSEPTESSVRAEVRAWLEANWSPDYGLVEWRTKLIESGWGAPHWPKEWYGRGLPVHLTPIVDEEFARIGAVGVAKAGIRTLAAATILDHGTDLHKEKFLRRILTGEDTWCQLFSEPGSGSDMAGAVTRADRRGNQWVINGQKVWTTSAHKAHWGLLLARANWDVAKHKGLAYFVLDMKQPGVQVHPLKQMNGHASFNQVFFTDAIVEHGLISKAANPEKYEVVGRLLSFDPYSIVVRRDDSAFRLVGNRVLADLFRSGEIEQIYDKWLKPFAGPLTDPLRTVYATQAKRVTDAMFIEAAEAVADQVTPEQLKLGMLFPPQSNILETEIKTAARVAKVVFDSNLARFDRPADVEAFIRSQVYKPEHSNLV